MPSGLAYVGRVEQLEPIPNADRIELATVVCGEGGKWCGVVPKGEYIPGSPCVAILQDAIVPASLGLDFLARTNNRVKMARFRGAPSECVITPTEIGTYSFENFKIGHDVTDVLEITKYVKELPASLNGVAIGQFPSFLRKTDEPNFQTSPRLIQALRGKPWVATVKCDGSSVTYYKLNGHFGVCSRNLELVESDCAAWKLAKKYQLPEKLPEGFAIQAEMVGPGIQANPLDLPEVDIRVFNVFDIQRAAYLDHFVAVAATRGFDVPFVETAGFGMDFNFDFDGLRALSAGVYEGTKKQREGIVIRPTTEEFVGQVRLSFKVLNLLYKD